MTAGRDRWDRIALGMVPPQVMHHLTPGQISVATTYAQDYIAKGYTDDVKAHLADRSKTVERVAQLTQTVLVEKGCIRIRKCTRPGRRGFRTVVEIIDQTWINWLRRAAREL